MSQHSLRRQLAAVAAWPRFNDCRTSEPDRRWVALTRAATCGYPRTVAKPVPPGPATVGSPAAPRPLALVSPADAFHRGRAAGYPAPPAQIRTCAANASGSCIESERKALIRVGMDDFAGRDPAAHAGGEALPRQVVPLAAPTQVPQRSHCIAVGPPVTRRPPHRSGLALLTHPAPAPADSARTQAEQRP